jgi:hypothetical protein
LQNCDNPSSFSELLLLFVFCGTLTNSNFYTGPNEITNCYIPSSLFVIIVTCCLPRYLYEWQCRIRGRTKLQIGTTSFPFRTFVTYCYLRYIDRITNCYNPISRSVIIVAFRLLRYINKGNVKLGAVRNIKLLQPKFLFGTLVFCILRYIYKINFY